MQRLINSRIFSNVTYPDFLYGEIKDKDYYKNALSHKNAKSIINLDIRNFFPNTRKKDVKRIFKDLFNFPEEVSECLATICTLRDTLPQGGCTSTHIANLIFFQKEVALYKKFENQNFVYSRLIDDITISSINPISQKKINCAIQSVQSMIGMKNFSLHSGKTRIGTTGNPASPTKVTGLIITNKATITVATAEIDEIKKDVHICFENGQINNYGEEYLSQHNKASGRVAKLQQIGGKDATDLRKKLREQLPNLDEDQIEKLKNKIRDIHKKSKSHRYSKSYHKYFYEICVRLNMYQRTHKNEAINLRQSLFK